MIISKNILSQALSVKTGHLNVVGLVEYKNSGGPANLILVSETGGRVERQFHIVVFHYNGKVESKCDPAVSEREAWNLFKTEMNKIIP